MTLWPLFLLSWLLSGLLLALVFGAVVREFDR